MYCDSSFKHCANSYKHRVLIAPWAHILTTIFTKYHDNGPFYKHIGFKGGYLKVILNF